MSLVDQINSLTLRVGAEVKTLRSQTALKTDPRFTDARTPLSHTHGAADITSAGQLAIAQRPEAVNYWHDHLAFGRQVGTPVMAKRDQASGTWTDQGSPEMAPFQLKELATIAIIPEGTAANDGCRYTWTSSTFAYSQIQYLGYSITYSATARTFDVVVERSTDSGATWIAIATDAGVTGSAITRIVALPGMAGSNNTSFRVTFIRTSGSGQVRLTQLRTFSDRKGDQGGGIENELPYDWDSNRKMIFRDMQLPRAEAAAGRVLTATDAAGNVQWSAIDRSTVGLSNVDNTSDLNKPLSTAATSALAGKENTLAAGSTSQYYRGDKSWQTLNAAAVGLANVSNTSDANKPISTATASALSLKADLVGGLIPTAQIPSIALGTVVPVASQAAMLALTTTQVQQGDLATRSDGAGTFMLTAADPSVLANWTLLNAPTDKVVSVNGQLGTVVLGKSDVGLANVDNTTDANKPISTATQSALNAKENTLAAGTTAQYYRGDKTWQSHDKASVGLGNVDNTSDANKPVSTAQATALSGKENTLAVGTSAQYYRGDKTWQTLNAAAVGLANVNNTSDAAKPVSTAQAAINALKADLVNGKVPAAQLPEAGKTFSISSVSNTNVTSIAGGTAEASPPSGLLAYFGSRASDLINVQGSGAWGSKWKNGGTATTSTTPWGVRFRASKTRYVELMVAPVTTDASMRIWVDGTENQLLPNTFPSFAANVFNTVKIDLGPEPRLVAPVIRIDLSSGMLLSKVWVETGGTITPAAETGKRVVILGDSLTHSETQNTGGELGSYVGYLSRYLGTCDIWNAGVRGTGPNKVSSNGGNYQTRASTDVANTNADIVVVTGFFNDRSDNPARTPAQVATDMGATVDTILAMSSKPTVIVTGSPDPTGGTNATEWATYDSAIQAAMQTRKVPYVSQSTGQITLGDGSVLTTQGPWIAPGMGTWLLGNDGLHPSDAGHQYLATRMWEAMNLILGQAGTQPVTRNTADGRYLPVANPTATGTLSVPTIKTTNGGVFANRFMKSTADGTGYWQAGPILADAAANYVATTNYLANILLLERDTGRIKISDGATQWSALPYLNDPAGNSYEQRNIFQTTGVDLTLTLPATPTVYLMRMYEIRTSAAVTITIPASVKLTTGLSSTLAVPSGKSAFIGLRYSIATSAWYLLSATVEA